MIGAFSSGILGNALLPALLGQKVGRMRDATSASPLSAIAGWGCKPNVRRAEQYAQRHGLPLLRLEDGFLRSFNPGAESPQLSLVVDAQGIYYDSTRPSALERMLASSADLLENIRSDVARAKSLILAHRLSKYNHAPSAGEEQFSPASKRVLVVDQTAGDMSVLRGGANSQTFTDMLAAAYAENPGATVYVKTHPEANSCRKGGYLTGVQDDDRTVVLRQDINPLSLIDFMDRVYVVSSTMGFEALLAGKPVSVFGMPWYAGWGVTEDRQRCERRSRTRTIEELFAAAYFHYTRYLDPRTHQLGSIFDVIDWLILQRGMAARFVESGENARLLCIGFRRWKAANVRPLLSLRPGRALFAPNARALKKLKPGPRDCLVHWGNLAPVGVDALAEQCGARTMRMEDGFIRSVGLGSDLIKPQSLVLDGRGIYFDPRRPSELEDLMNEHRFTAGDHARARVIRRLIVEEGITKYNTEPRTRPHWAGIGDAADRPVVLVPGQVEDDASIRFGCEDVKTNLGLLQAARAAHPNAFIVYKPHPEVLARNRPGVVSWAAAHSLADVVETAVSVVSCIEVCDVVHTMTSLTGFDALLRNKKVVVYGRPFYAGWGLTEDRHVMPRRRRSLSLDELVAAALVHYPVYWDWELGGYTTCEAVLHGIVRERTKLEANGGLARLQGSQWARQWRKVATLVRSWRG